MNVTVSLLLGEFLRAPKSKLGYHELPTYRISVTQIRLAMNLD